MNSGTMYKFVIISDPNHCLGGDEDFRVHRAGCRDAKKHVNHPRFNNAGVAMNVDAETAKDAVAAQIAEFESMEMSYGEHDFKICNCCRLH